MAIVTKTSRVQLIIDMAFGGLLIAPMIYGLIVPAAMENVILISIGVAASYFLHVTQKVISFNAALSNEVEEKAEETVEEQAQEKVKEKVDETVPAQVEETVEEKIEDMDNDE